MITIKPIALSVHLHCSGLQLYEDFSIINRRLTNNLNTVSKLLKWAYITLGGICACSSRYSLTLPLKTTLFPPYSSRLALKLSLCSLLRNGVKENIEAGSAARDLSLCRTSTTSLNSSVCIFPHHSFSEVLTNWWAHFKRIRGGK